jgi:hypothetical protein
MNEQGLDGRPRAESAPLLPLRARLSAPGRTHFRPFAPVFSLPISDADRRPGRRRRRRRLALLQRSSVPPPLTLLVLATTDDPASGVLVPCLCFSLGLSQLGGHKA